MPPIDIKFSTMDLANLNAIITSYMAQPANYANVAGLKNWVANLPDPDAEKFFCIMHNSLVFTKQQHNGDNVIAAINKMIVK